MDWGKAEDSVLIKYLKDGNRIAFNAIYFRYAEVLYQYALNILKEPDDCEDVVQNIFIWLWENRQQLQISNLRGYLLAATKFNLTRKIVSSKRREEILSSTFQADPIYEEESLEIKELRSAIFEGIQLLPPKARQIYQLSREDHLSNKEIAARLGISEKTVEAQITISLKKLKTHLGKMSFWIFFL
ncbi:RNA polymerase sigma-70 factor [Pedobacter ginsengisoli]|uniref:RNA polymerase sigma-70 factor n=1 Tax=Pedobacter ginsengisoli TaxID=363852 RepID=A0A2D1U714_9SPHI|nr:RNA polymerase sigma-70 factor [Pedobacter ginsengisoli]ATP57387.1 RNA polymerase sigma-70 factor [Pedobacter ginsengisoli]